MERCQECQFFESQNGAASVQGLCRRHAPSLSPLNAKPYMIEGVWPTVRTDDWCGEWRTLARRAEARPAEVLNAISANGAMTPRVTALPTPPTAASAPAALAIGRALGGND
ncbi:MAG: hypothetical protein JSR18_03445 [Proteobacteria bacterium]|nr:hypothetical protein [Pseudomonadota bacterium]